MSEEEKKAIEHLKIVAKDRTILPLDDEISIALNLIEKQQKEIEELKQEKYKYEDWVMRTCISKDKIREKLKYLDEEGYFEFNTDRDLVICCEILRSFLEE